MASAADTQLVKNGSTGLEVLKGSPGFESVVKLADTAVRAVDVSDDGRLLAWAEKDRVRVVALSDYSPVFEASHSGVTYLKISPKGNVLASWHPIKGKDTEGQLEANQHLWDINSGTLLQSFVVKQMSRWCPAWTSDEAICCRHLNMELQFHENNSFERYAAKMFAQKVHDFSLVTNKATGIHHLACYSMGTKGQPSFVRLYEYPRFGGVALANKSFFKADTVTFLWNAKGDAVLLLCATEVDKSGKSYYGEQSLHYLDVKGETFAVKLSKGGPIHNVAWTPSTSKECLFCVVYGFVPPKASLFNTKSDVVFDFGEAPVNQICFNPFGNLLVLAGFGNLRGGVHVWDVQQKNKLAEFKCPETTDIAWCPDGYHIMTATTTPRLRVGNGFKIWTYTGKNVHEETYPNDVELYKVLWQPAPGLFAEPVLPAPVAGAKAKNVKAPPAPRKYVPPGMRKDHERAVVIEQGLRARGGNSKPLGPALTETEKKIKNLEKKLEQISKLKEMQKSGKPMEKNQLEKISKEEELEEELDSLRL